MPAAVIGAVATVGGAAIASGGARSATRAQQQSAAQATAEQRRQYDTTRTDYAPYREAGYGALNRLNAASTGDMSGFYTSPGYQFRLDEGTRNIGNSFAARGGAASGNALKALAQFNQGQASSEFGNWWNQQAGLVNAGSGANAATSAAGANAANAIGNYQIGAGDARASGLVGQSNVWGNALNSLGNQVGQWWQNRPLDEIKMPAYRP